MQIVEIELTDGYPFYCPITGELILSEEDFKPSPAMVYCYIKNDSLFEYTNSQANNIFNNISNDDGYFDSEVYDEILSSLPNNKTAKNWICFRMHCGGSGIGSYVVDYCIDMGYQAG